MARYLPASRVCCVQITEKQLECFAADSERTMRLPIKMPPSGDKRRWRYWISNYWRRWTAVCVVVLMAGHLLISQVSLSDLSRQTQMAREAPRHNPNQADRRLNMIVTPWTANNSSTRPTSAASDEFLASEKLLGGQLLKPQNKILKQPDKSSDETSSSAEQQAAWMHQQELKYRQRNERIRQVCQQRHVTAADPAVILNHNRSTIIRQPGTDEGEYVMHANEPYRVQMIGRCRMWLIKIHLPPLLRSNDYNAERP